MDRVSTKKLKWSWIHLLCSTATFPASMAQCRAFVAQSFRSVWVGPYGFTVPRSPMVRIWSRAGAIHWESRGAWRCSHLRLYRLELVAISMAAASSLACSMVGGQVLVFLPLRVLVPGIARDVEGAGVGVGVGSILESLLVHLRGVAVVSGGSCEAVIVLICTRVSFGSY